jgi:hypothetical protein
MDVRSLDNLIMAKMLGKFSLLSYDELFAKGIESLEYAHQ